MEIGQLVWKITGDTSGIFKSVKDADKAIEKFGKNAKKVGGTLTKYATLPILALGAVAIKTASDLERQEVAFQKLLKSAKKGTALFEELKKFSATTPLQLNDIAVGAERLLAFGVAQEDVINKLQRLGDLARGDAGRLNRLTNAYGKLKAKGKATLEELNLFTEAGIPLMQELAKANKVTTQEMFKLIETGQVGFKDVDEVLKSLTETGGLFEGQMESASKTTSGKLSTAIDNVKLAMAEFGAVVLPEVNKLLEKIISVSQWFAKLSSSTKRTIIILAGMGAVIGPVASAIGVLTLAVKAFNLTALAGPAGIIVLVGTAIAGLILLRDHMNQAKKATADYGKEVKRVYGENSKAYLKLLDDREKEIDALTRLGELGQKNGKLKRAEKKEIKDLLVQFNLLDDAQRLGNGNLSKGLKNQKLGLLFSRLVVKLEKEHVESTNKLKIAQDAGTEAGKNKNKITSKEIKLLTDLEKKIIENKIAQAENDGDFKTAKALRLQLINDEALAEERILKKQKAGAEDKTNANKALIDNEIYYNQLRGDLDDEYTDKVKANAEARKEAIINASFEAFSAVSGLINTLNQNRIDALDAELEAELDKNGLLEKTALEQAEADLVIAKKSGNKQAIEDAQREADKQTLLEKYDKKKRRLEYESALFSWGLTLAETTARGFMAVQTALATLPPANIPLSILTGTMATANALNVLAQKPKFAQGIMDVPSDMEAIIHKSEMIIPAPFAESVRAGDIAITGNGAGGGSGQTLNLTVIADGQETHYEKMKLDSKNNILTLYDTAIIKS